VLGPFEKGHYLGQGVGSEDDVYVGKPLRQRRALLLRHASPDAHDEVGPFRLEPLELRHSAVEPLLGVGPDAARVEEYHVGGFGVLRPHISGLFQKLSHHFRSVLVHLAAKGDDMDRFPPGSPVWESDWALEIPLFFHRQEIWVLELTW
jgi:hypothetical protein